MLSSNEQLMLQNKYSNRAQWEKEFNDQEKQLGILLEATEILKKQIALQKENNAIAVDPENYKLLKPTWKFEEDPTYMKNHREITLINHKLKDMELDGIIKNREIDYKRVLDQHEDMRKSLESLNAEIKILEEKDKEA